MLFFEGGGALPILLGALVGGNDHADSLGQITYRIRERHAAVLHEEANGVAVRTAAKTMVGLARGTDREARRLFVVEGAQALVADARFFELNMLPDDVNDVGSAEEILEKLRRNHFPSLLNAQATRANDPDK